MFLIETYLENPCLFMVVSPGQGLSWPDSLLDLVHTTFLQQTEPQIHTYAQPPLNVSPTCFSPLSNMHDEEIHHPHIVPQSICSSGFSQIALTVLLCALQFFLWFWEEVAKNHLQPADTQLWLGSCTDLDEPLLASVSWGPGLIFKVEVPHLKPSR